MNNWRSPDEGQHRRSAISRTTCQALARSAALLIALSAMATGEYRRDQYCIEAGFLRRQGFVVARNPGVVDALEASLFKLKPQTVYSVYVSGQKTPVAAFKTNAMGMANGTAIGPLREAITSLSTREVTPSRIIVMEGDAEADASKAVLASAL
jgi:hypothetical protein